MAGKVEDDDALELVGRSRSAGLALSSTRLQFKELLNSPTIRRGHFLWVFLGFAAGIALWATELLWTGRFEVGRARDAVALSVFILGILLAWGAFSQYSASVRLRLLRGRLEAELEIGREIADALKAAERDVIEAVESNNKSAN